MKKSANQYIFKYLTWGFLVASIVYLIYVLSTFDEYHKLWQALQTTYLWDFGWLLTAFLLLPINLLIESFKWKKTVENLEKLSIKQSFKAVVAGISSGFITPNRIGDIVGKLNYLQSKNHKAAISLGAISGITQNIAIILPSIPFAILFFIKQETEIQKNNYFVLVALIICILIFALFTLPKISQKITRPNLQPYFQTLAEFKFKDLIIITSWSILRFVVFSLQLYLLLIFFGVHLSISQAIIGITTNYLLVTITPSIAISEAFVRTSWAVFVLSRFSDNTAGILLAGLSLWLINVATPVIVGNIFLATKKEP